MRTSTKILIVTFALLLGCLAFYDIKLKTEYEKGDYTNPYYDFVNLGYKNFNAVELNSSTAVNIMLVQGPFKVMAAPQATDFLDIRKEGDRLIIGAKFPDHFRGISAVYAVYISCPSLASFKADAFYLAGKNKITDTAARDLSWRPTIISGFSCDTLKVEEDHAANLIFQNNRINHFTAVVGAGSGSGSALTIGQNNKLSQTDISIMNKSRLWIKGTDINNISYRLADSASVIINGAAAKHLLNLK